MGNKDADVAAGGTTATRAVTAIKTVMFERDLSYAWLARRANVPYKRVLAELKHGRSPITLESTLQYTGALDIELPDLIERAKQVAA